MPEQFLKQCDDHVAKLDQKIQRLESHLPERNVSRHGTKQSVMINCPICQEPMQSGRAKIKTHWGMFLLAGLLAPEGRFECDDGESCEKIPVSQKMKKIFRCKKCQTLVLPKQ